MDSQIPHIAYFGDREVAWEEKAGLVRGVFDRVAGRYDLMNDLMSGGLHRWWKLRLQQQLPLAGTGRLLDVAGGTGDIALRALAKAPQAHITVCDINPHMLEEGRDRAIDRGALQGIDWVCGNAESLPMNDMAVDVCTIAFGIRNVTDIPKALREMRRVLKPGGTFLCLEFSQVPSDLLAKLYDYYSFKVIPALGKIVAGDDAPYRYLVESIRRFPDAERFSGMLREAGFTQVSYERLSGGIVALHRGRRT